MTRGRSLRRWLIVATAAALVGAAVFWYRGGTGGVVGREHCEASVDGRTVDLSPDQAENAATIAAVAKRRELPARAVTIALATAYQESKIRNLPGGHADSVGIFQQRPSLEVWGTAEQIRDPYHATNKFYDALQRIDGYEEMEITVAAQRVQRSAYPDAYAKHEPEARVLASALTGNSPAAFTCVVRVTPYPGDAAAPGEVLASEIARAFGPAAVGRTGEFESVVAVADAPSEATLRRGWAMAHWLVAHADRLHVSEVAYDGRSWSASRPAGGWSVDRGTQPDGTRIAVRFSISG